MRTDEAPIPRDEKSRESDEATTRTEIAFAEDLTAKIEDLPGDISGYIAESIATVIHEKERGNGMCSCGERIEVKEKAGLVAMSESGGMRE
jgi:hypothetical protein